jgi:hypothetical protein
VARVPSIVLLFGAGLLLGPDGAGWIEPDALGDGLFSLVSIAVAVILFEGALGLDLKRLRREGRTIRALVTTGALVTWAGAAFTARLVLGWSWELAILFGAMVIVTGPTVIGPLLRSLRRERAARGRRLRPLPRAHTRARGAGRADAPGRGTEGRRRGDRRAAHRAARDGARDARRARLAARRRRAERLARSEKTVARGRSAARLEDPSGGSA